MLLTAIQPNALFHADCIELMQRIDEESIDMVYLDPPRVPQILEPPHASAEKASESERQHLEHLEFLSKVCQHVERILCQTGVVFFHTQPSSAFSVRLILNQVFGEMNFRNEFAWQYRRSSSYASNPSGLQHDVIFLYSKFNTFTCNPVRRPLLDSEVRRLFPLQDDRGRFKLVNLVSLTPHPDLHFEWNGVTPPQGRSWRFSLQNLERLEQKALIHRKTENSIPRLKVYHNESDGVDVGTVWKDIPPLGPASRESVHYSTQKPLGVLERIVLMGSNPGDVVLDPFCGSGTTLVAAERNRRHWMACDIAEEAIEITTMRLVQEFGDQVLANFTVGHANDINTIPVTSPRYRPLVLSLDGLPPPATTRFVLGEPLEIEETRYYEFKEIGAKANAVRSITSICDEYAVCYLNSEGGRLYWGIRDSDRVVVGVKLSYQERDKIRRDVTCKLAAIEPRIDPTQYKIGFHLVFDEDGDAINDVYVVELIVPNCPASEPYYTGSGDAWAKCDGVKIKLKGTALTDFIRRRDNVQGS